MVAAIALGSNLSSAFGPPEANLREALRRLADVGDVTAVSSFHLTAPVGNADQPDFLNAAALLATEHTAEALLHALLAIERRMGRDRAHATPKGPRIIDLDLLLYGEQILSTPTLQLPHAEMHRRSFVLAPLAEIAPAMLHPVLQRSIIELRDGLA